MMTNTLGFDSDEKTKNFLIVRYLKHIIDDTNGNMFHFPLWKLMKYKWKRSAWDRNSAAQQFVGFWSVCLFRNNINAFFCSSKGIGTGQGRSYKFQSFLVGFIHFIGNNYEVDTAEMWGYSFFICLGKKCKRPIHFSVNYNNARYLLLTPQTSHTTKRCVSTFINENRFWNVAI